MPTTTPRLIASRYRLGLFLGEGGSGAVYRATDLLLDRQVAVKCMKAAAGRDQSQDVQAFQSEARTLARIEHPHIVDIHDVGLDDGGKPYFVMELAEDNLRGLLRHRDGRLGLEELLDVFLPLCGALACAHDLRIVHCDLKPENIAVRQMGGQRLRGKLLDFSISRRDEGQPPVGVVFGTPGYMPPEQIRGERCTPRSDVWALGALLFECVTGRLPFTAADVPALSRLILAEDAPALHTIAPHVPQPVALAIERALARNPERRFADMRQLAHALVSAGVQAHVRVPVDPDPVGLPDAPRWHSQSGTVTDSLSPIAPVPPIDSVRRPQSAATASPGTTGMRRTGSSVLLLVALFALSGAGYVAARLGRARLSLAASAPQATREPAAGAPGQLDKEPLARRPAPASLSPAFADADRSPAPSPSTEPGPSHVQSKQRAPTTERKRQRSARPAARESDPEPKSLELHTDWEW